MIDTDFADRDGFIWLDGALVPWREARIHVLTHGLHYASAIFEGQRAYEGRIFKLSEHSQRLIDSARALGFELPWSRLEIDEACNQTLRANQLTDCYMRPIAWRGSEQMSVAARRSRPHLAIACWSTGTYFGEEALEKGLRLNVAPYRRPAPHTAPVAAKAAGLYMICTVSKDLADQLGYHDSLMLDWRGQVAEATAANIFFIEGGVVHTPTPDCFLDGITRRTVIALLRSRGVSVVERAIWPEELSTFEECFLTGSAAEVTPVSEIGPWSFVVGELTKDVRREYGRLVRSERPPL